MAEAFETNLALGQDGNTSTDVVDYFRNRVAALSDGAITLDPLTLNSAAITRVKDGTIPFAWGSATAIVPGSHPTDWDNLFFTMPFGMEPLEHAAWWYDGGGAALHQALLAAQAPAITVYQHPVGLRAAESGGWFKEPLTLKKMLDGRYSDGSQMRFRAFGEAQSALNAAFPNIVTPAVAVGSTEIQDLFSGNFNGGEFNEPLGDASPTTPSLGLFPKWPTDEGSILAAGIKNYYMGSWHTPYRCRALWINKAYYDGLTAQQKAWIDDAARSATLHNLTSSLVGQDAILEQWQALGATIIEGFPRDILDRLRNAVDDYMDSKAASDPTEYGAVLTSMRDFAKANGVRWRAGTLSRAYRFQRTTMDSDFRPNIRVR